MPHSKISRTSLALSAFILSSVLLSPSADTAGVAPTDQPGQSLAVKGGAGGNGRRLNSDAAAPGLRPLYGDGLSALWNSWRRLAPEPLAFGMAAFATLEVNSTNDVDDGTCNATHCSLREAINIANASAGVPDTITFNITGAGPHIITPATLPEITDTVTIDGYTQPGSSPNTLAAGNDAVLMIELNGALSGGDGLKFLGANNCVVRGLVINRWARGIRLEDGGGHTVQGNLIGTNPGGTIDLGNTFAGVDIVNSSNNLVGGTTPAARNLISGNGAGVEVTNLLSSANAIRGNYIGTDRAGTSALANASGGVRINSGTNTFVGGTAAGAGNVISGNGGGGVLENAANTGGTLIQGNLIGPNRNGTLGLANNGPGVSLGSNSLVGGGPASARNTISGNSDYGVIVFGNNNAIRGNYVGVQTDGQTPLGNATSGVAFSNNASFNTLGGTNPGEGNVIAFNSEDGVLVGDGVGTSVGNRINGNSITTNGTTGTHLGIDLGAFGGALDGVTPNDAGDGDAGPNNLQNAPAITSAQSFGSNVNVVGLLSSAPSTTYRVEFFSNLTCDPSGAGEGRTFLGSANLTTDAAGVVNFDLTIAAVPFGENITATATDPAGNTSEFSGCAVAASAATCLTPSLTAPTAIASGGPVDQLVVGDFNGDGKQDLAGAVFFSGNVAVWLGNGAGGFGPATNFGVGTNPESVAVGDFNADGKQDLAVANRGSDNVSILLGNGAGGFAAAANFPLATTFGEPRSVAVADLNADGRQDLIVGVNSEVSVLLGDGTGAFGPASSFPTTAQPFSLVVSDFNNDGIQDVVGVIPNNDSVVVLPGNGTGGFGAGAEFSTNCAVTGTKLAVADFNNDGDEDLIVGCSAETSFLLGDGTGTFDPTTVLNTDSQNGIAAGDFDGDGNQDLALSNGAANAVSLRLGDGGGLFGPASDFGTINGPDGVTAGDFNADGKPDVATADFNTSIFVQLNNCSSAVATDVFWINPAGGNWNVAANWQDGVGANRVPVANDAVFITLDSPVTVNLNVNATVKSLTIGNATNATTQTFTKAAQTLTVTAGGAVGASGVFTQSGGTSNLAGTFTVGGTFAQSGGTLVGIHTFAGAGAFNWSGGSLSGGGAVTTIAAGFDLNISGAADKTLLHGNSGSNGHRLENFGTVTWTGAGNIRAGDGSNITNKTGGIFDVQTDASFVYAGFGNEPSFLNEDDAVLRKSAGVTTTFGRFNFTNNGTIDVQAGSFLFNDANASHAFNNGTLITGPGAVRLGGAATTFTGAVTIDTSLELSAGSLSGVHTFSGAGAFNWTGGALRGGGAVTTIAAGFDLNISGAADKTLLHGNSGSNGHRLENFGTIIWTGTGNIRAGDSSNITNGSAALFDIQTDASFVYAGFGNEPAFTNQAGATLRKSTGVATAFGRFNFTNTGLVEVLSGSLNFPDIDGSHTFGNNSTLAGVGAVRFSGATVTMTGTQNIDTTVELSAGLFFGTHTLSGSGSFEWTGGSIRGGGSPVTTIGAGFEMNISGAAVKSLINGNGISGGHRIANSGTITWTGAGVINVGDGSVITNQAGGLFDIQTDADFVHPFGNAGAFTNQTGATLRKSAAGLTLFPANVGLSNAGTVEILAGELRDDNGFTQTAGSILLNGGSLSAGGAVVISGGELRGVGTVTANVSNTGGAVRPGLSPGCLDIVGNYTQGAAGALDVEIGGNTVCSQFDRLAVTGLATLAGTLNAALINGFSPPAGAVFQVMTFGSRVGNFTTVNGPFTVNASANDIQLVHTLAPTGTIVVTNTGDSGAGSLRQAILDSNATAAQETITFNIPGAGVRTISPSSDLPQITNPVVIDGYAQPGASPNTLAVGNNAVILIELNGSNGAVVGLDITAGGSTVRGLVINSFTNASVRLATGGGNVLQGNFIGTNAAGTANTAATSGGLDISNSANNQVGGTNLAARNLISNDNGSRVQCFACNGLVLQGNYIGTNAAGTAALDNTGAGVNLEQSSNVQVGGAAPGASNVISGNFGGGVRVDAGSGTAVRGNLIGTGATGAAAIPNNSEGVLLENCTGVTVGGAGGANVIAFNAGPGIRFESGAGNSAPGNSVFSNAGLGIDLGTDGLTPNDPGDADAGANNLQNFPVLTSASSSGGTTTVQGTLNSAPGTTYRVEFFSNATCDPSGNGEGRTFLGFQNVTTDGAGNAAVNAALPSAVAAGEVVTATATDPAGNTSEFSACVAGAGTCVATLPGVLAWYPAEGSTNDVAGGHNPSATNAVGFAPGRVGQGFTFGPNGFIDIPHAADLATQTVTVEAWVRPDGPGPNNDTAGSVIFNKNINTFSGPQSSIFLAWSAADQRFNWGVFDDGVRSDRPFPPGFLYHVAATYDGATIRLYVNGELAAQKAHATTIVYDPSVPYTIGANFSGFRAAGFPRTWNGVIDELKLYGRAISQAEARAVFDAGLCGVPADLSVTKTDAPDPVAAGDFLNYTITVTNNGADFATGVAVSDAVPAGATFVSATPSQGNCSGVTTVNCQLGTLFPGASATVILTVTPDAAGTLTNTATVSGTQPDPNTANNSATATTTVNAGGPVFSISGRVTENGAGRLGINITLSGASNRVTTTDANGDYTFAGLPAGGNFVVTPFETNYRFSPASRAVNNLSADTPGQDFAATLVNHTITGTIVDQSGRGIPDVVVTLAGSLSLVTRTDQNGVFTFRSVPSNGSFTVTPEKEGLEFNPRRRAISGISGDERFESVGTIQPAPTPTPDPSDDFSGGPDPDFEKWSIGILTNPPSAFDPLVRVFLADGLLHIRPRANTFGPSFSGLVTARALDLNTTPIVSVEAVRPATGEATQTIFGLGTDADNYFRFVVQDEPNPSAAGSAESRKAGAEGTPQQLLFELSLGGGKFSSAVGFDPSQHRFWRFRHDAPAALVIFETSPDSVNWTERFRAELPRDRTRLIAELSSGSLRPSRNPVEALFDNFIVSPTPRAQFPAGAVNVTETTPAAVVEVVRVGNAESPLSVDFSTSDGTATAGQDYTAVSRRLVFGVGERLKRVSIPVIDDALAEGTETIRVRLSNPVGGTLGSISAAVVNILDDEVSDNPIDDSRFFVTQHYLDFLGREPDEPGLLFWVDQIEQCGDDRECRRVRRVNVSAAFFLSIEFQETGYFVHRLFRATFNRPPLFDEYLPALSAIREGVIIGTPGANELLEANRLRFIQQWGERPDVRARFAQLNEMQFVDEVFASAGITPAEEERTALITGLLTRRQTRGGVLARVADSDAFKRSEFNTAFVRMEYFGYLRRDPDEGGFRFWLRKLNDFGGNFIRAEMVRAFIESLEYRGRFRRQ